MGGMDY